MDMAIIWAILITVLMGAASGVVTALFGLLKKREIPEVDSYKFFSTVALGAIVGGIAGYHGWDYMTADQWLLSSGLIAFIEFVLKTLWRRLNLAGINGSMNRKAVKSKKKGLKKNPKRKERWLDMESDEE